MIFRLTASVHFLMRFCNMESLSGDYLHVSFYLTLIKVLFIHNYNLDIS